MNNRKMNPSWLVVLFMLAAIAFFYIWMSGSAQEQDKDIYSDIIYYFEDQQVTEFNLDYGTGVLSYKLKGEDGVKKITIANPEYFISQIAGYVDEYNEKHPAARMDYEQTYTTPIGSLIMSILPTLLLVLALGGFLYYSYRQQNGGGKIGGFGKARTRGEAELENRTTFLDVAGADEEKEELVEIVEFLKNPGKFNTLGARIPKGVLLIGPPGTGKTLLARAVAGEAKVPFFSISGSDFVEMYVGVGASRVRDLFDKAKRTAPSIIFIDEIDAVGRQRGAGLGGGHDEREQTLNQLLVEMDGFSANEGVIVMAATNRSDILDRALLRPGRFDREVYVGYPDVKGREEILKVHARNKPIGPDVELGIIAKTTTGFTGADLENLLNEAALLAARKNRKAITMDDVNDATIKVIAGPEKKSKVVTEKEHRLTAYHEAGHAIVTYFCKPDTPVHEISIIPRGMAGGYTISLPSEDANFSTKSEMESEIVSLLGGRAAEKLKLEDISTGASNDIERATMIARSMVTKYGFSDKLGPVVYGSGHDEVFLGRDFTQSRNYSEEIASAIDEEIKTIIERAFARAEKVLSDNDSKLDELAAALLEHEKIDGETFKKVMESKQDTPVLEE